MEGFAVIRIGACIEQQLCQLGIVVLPGGAVECGESEADRG